MRAIQLVIVGIIAVAARAQQPAVPTMKTFASSAEVQALIANARKIRKDGQALVSQPLLQLTTYRASLEYRASAGTAAVHPKEAELFYVIEGEGTLVTGGRLAGTAIEGGAAQTISKGDFVFVPENTAHWFSQIKTPLALMSIHVPAGAN